MIWLPFNDQRCLGSITEMGLSKLFVVACKPQLHDRESVRGGQVIGYAAKAPFRIGFELWQWTDDAGFVAVDPSRHMRTWSRAPSAFTASGLLTK